MSLSLSASTWGVQLENLLILSKKCSSKLSDSVPLQLIYKGVSYAVLSKVPMHLQTLLLPAMTFFPLHSSSNSSFFKIQLSDSLATLVWFRAYSLGAHGPVPSPLSCKQHLLCFSIKFCDR